MAQGNNDGNLNFNLPENIQISGSDPTLTAAASNTVPPNAAASNAATPNATTPNVESLFNLLKSQTQKLNEIQTTVDDRISGLEKEIVGRKRPFNVAIGDDTRRQDASISRSSTITADDNESTNTAKYFDGFMNKKKLRQTFAVLICRFLVFCHVKNYPAAAHWMDESLTKLMDKTCPSVMGMSGLSLMMFAVGKGKTEFSRIDLLNTPHGHLFTHLIAHCVMDRTMKVIHKVYTRQEQRAPLWTKHFGSSFATRLRVLAHELNFYHSRRRPLTQSELEAYSGIPNLSPPKPSRSTRPSETEKLRFGFLKALLKRFLAFLRIGRGEVRTCCFRDELFLLSEIESKPLIANTKRYIMTLMPGGNYEVPAQAEETDNDIDNSPRNEPDDEDEGNIRHKGVYSISESVVRPENPPQNWVKPADDANETLFEELKEAFPCMYAWMTYPVPICAPKRDTEGTDTQEFEALKDKTWEIRETISFHDMAKNVLCGLCGKMKFEEIAETNIYALRAVHILALGLRGLTAKALNVGDISNVPSNLSLVFY